MFNEYYDRLVNVLPAVELSHYFVSDKIISLNEHDRVIRSSFRQEAAILVLNKILVQLQSGNNKIFKTLLQIIVDHGTLDPKNLSQEIIGKLSAEKCEDHVISSDGQGNYVHIQCHIQILLTSYVCTYYIASNLFTNFVNVKVKISTVCT